MTTTVKPRSTPWLKGAVIAAVVAIIVLWIAAEITARVIKARITDELGPHAHWSAMNIGLAKVTITDFYVDAEQGWPTEQEVSAKTVVVTPRIDSLIRRRPVVLEDLVASDGVATFLRTKDGLEILPVLSRQDEPSPAEPSTIPKLWIQKMRFERIKVDFYDRTVAPKDYKIHLEPAGGTLSGFRVPAAGSVLNMSFAAPVIAPSGQQSGTLSLSGTYTPHVGSDLQIDLSGVGVDVLGPYMAKAGGTGISAGTADLSARSQVDQGKVNATGVLTLHDIQVRTSGSVTDTVLGLPRTAVIDQLKNRHGDVVLHFSIQGDEHDPKFSLNEVAATKISAGLAEALGLPVQDLAKGVGDLGEQGLSAAGHAASDVGDAVKKIFK
jgi:hypothetical protein